MYYAGKVGLGVAIDYALRWDVETTWTRIKMLAQQLRSQLVALGFVTIHDLGVERCGIVTFNIEGIAADEVQRKLLEMGINVSVSLEESGRLDLAERKIPQLVRASVHYYNSEEEIERFCDAVAQLRLKDL
jgi:selenocysteine lyase/cysteine desulfurase